MNGNIAYLTLLSILGILLPLHAQQTPSSSLVAEDLLYRGESVTINETLADEYAESGQMPVSLNSASAGELETSGLFTLYQIYSLLNYREKYGPFYSLYELSALPGFTPRYIEKIKAFLYVDSIRKPEGNRPGRHMLLLTLERDFPGGQAYGTVPLSESTSLYQGSPLKSTIRIRSHPGKRFSLGLTYEKDAGETFLYQNKPQYISGYLSYEGKHFLKQLVLGNFTLNQGLGLVNGCGFMHRAGDYQLSPVALSRIRPYASSSESLFEQGIACKMGSDNCHVLLWASYHHFSLAPSTLSEELNPEQWPDRQLTTGLFRTGPELEARDLAYRIHTGIQVLYRKKGLQVGVMNGYEWIGATTKGIGHLEKIPDPALLRFLSLHANWYRGRFQLCGELAGGEFDSPAFLFSTSCHFNDFIQGSMLIHHYADRYRGSLPSSYASGSKIRNEQGIAFKLHLETGKSCTAEFTSEFFRYPSPRYLCRVPSHGYRLDLTLGNPAGNTLQWRTRIVSRTWQTSPVKAAFRVRPLLDSRISRFDGQLIYNRGDHFRWQSRLVLGFYSGQESSSPAYAALQQLTLGNSRILKITAQTVLFHVSDWENRIYLYEPGFYYSFNCPAYYGTGQKTTILLTLKPVKELMLSLKIAAKTDRRNKDWEAGVQIRLSL